MKPSERRRRLQLPKLPQKFPKLSKKLLIVIGLVILCSFALFVFLYLGYFTRPVYNDVNEAISDIVASKKGVKYSLTDLPAGKCYWIRPGYNEEGHFVEIIEYDSEDSCIGMTTNYTFILLESALNIGTTDCICSKNSYTISKKLSTYGIDLDVVLK